MSWSSSDVEGRHFDECDAAKSARDLAKSNGELGASLEAALKRIDELEAKCGDKASAALEAVFTEMDGIVEAVEDMPHWLSEAGVDVPDTRKLAKLVAAYKHATFVAPPPPPPPTTFAEVVAQIAAAHKQGNESYRTLSLDNTGTSWALCDGTCALIVQTSVCERSTLPKIEDRFSDDAERKFNEIFSTVRAAETSTVSLSQLEAWASLATSYEGSTRTISKVGMVGGQAVDVERVARFVVNVARLVDGDISVRVDKSAMQVGFGGAGWEVVVMGIRIEGIRIEDTVQAPELLTVSS